ncbi:MAG: transposase [Colwellia sp.]|jgi:transposase
MQRGKHRNVVVAAIAREMVVYIWAISREIVLVPIAPKTRLSGVPA